MPVQTIECHIATVLMKRFLDGDDLPTEMLDELERHVKACPGCQGTLNNEKMTIEEVLDGPAEKSGGFGGVMAKFGMKPATAGGFANTYPTEALVAAARIQTTTSPGGLAAFKNPKVLFLSAGLAVVLIAMSTVMRDPTMLFGKKAAVVAYDARNEGDKGPEGEKAADDGSGHKADGGADLSHEAEAGAAPGSHDEAGSVTNSKEGSAAQDTHGEGTSGETLPVDGHSAEAKPVDSHVETAHEPAKSSPTKVNGMTVPGEKTVDHSSVILVGPNGASEHKTEPKPAVHSKTAGSQKATSHTAQEPGTRRSSTHRTSSQRSPTKKAPTKPKSGGIKVYDSSGKPVH